MAQNDARDVLLGQQQAVPSVAAPAKPATSEKRRKSKAPPPGISRELYALVGGIPPLVPSSTLETARPGLREAVRAQSSLKWRWVPFSNSARSDKLQLSHWLRSDVVEEDYPFAKLNKHISVPDLSESDYTAFRLHTEPGDWTLAETRYLLDLCRTFDLRFTVISDRYAFPIPDQGVRRRPIEDLKDRYYLIMRRLYLHQHPNATLNDLKMYDYNKQRELERRRHLDLLYARSAASVREEAFLLIESRRLEQHYKRLLRERQALFRLHSGHMDLSQILPSGPHAASAGGSNVANARNRENDEKRRRKRKKEEALAAASGAAAATVGTELEEDENLVPEDGSGGIRRGEKFPPGAFIRSSRMQTVRSGLVKHVERVLAELGLPLRPKVPSSRVCAAFDELRSLIVTLLETKKAVDKLEQEVRIARVRVTHGDAAAAAVAAQASAVLSPLETSATPSLGARKHRPLGRLSASGSAELGAASPLPLDDDDDGAAALGSGASRKRVLPPAFKDPKRQRR